MKSVFVAIIALVVIASAPAFANRKRIARAALQPDKRDAKIVSEVRAVLDAQAAAWNRGNIEVFMQGYWRSPDTVFVSGDNVTRGWQTVLERYQKSYNSPEKMGTLSFTELEIKPIGKDAAVALGRWQLVRKNDSPHGRFTLIFRRMKDGWRIVHDHTSSA